MMNCFEIIISFLKLMKDLGTYVINEDCLFYYCVETGKFYKITKPTFEYLVFKNPDIKFLLLDDYTFENRLIFKESSFLNYKFELRIPMSFFFDINKIHILGKWNNFFCNPNILLVFRPDYVSVFLEYPCRTFKLFVIIYKESYIEHNLTNMFTEI